MAKFVCVCNASHLGRRAICDLHQLPEDGVMGALQRLHGNLGEQKKTLTSDPHTSDGVVFTDNANDEAAVSRSAAKASRNLGRSHQSLPGRERHELAEANGETAWQAH